MFKFIKSYYFKRIILSIIPSKIELKLMKYNKSLQQLVNLSIIDYINFSGRYIKYDTNGNGKEFGIIFNNLIYEGEYKNGERNGKGKEYDRNGNLIFEGEYLNGKKWNGIGNKNNNKKYYKIEDGKGYINESDIDGVIFYEGEYTNGERNGKGREYSDNHLYFLGEYKNGKKWAGIGFNESNQPIFILNQGKGNKILICDYSGILEYEYTGKYLNGESNGLGKEFCCETEITYIGEFLNGIKSGKGKEYYKKQLIFEGEYLLNKKYNGFGYDENGTIVYQVKNGNGKVKEYFPNRSLMYEGEYKKCKKEGKGT